MPDFVLVPHVFVNVTHWISMPQCQCANDYCGIWVIEKAYIH